MVGLAIEVDGLVKRYGPYVTAVDGLDLRVEEGETYGLLGPNGAGKTTVIRMLLGLVRPTSGFISVLGRRPGDPAALGSLGAMGETGFYPFLSGRNNLRSIARRCGVSDEQVEVVLDQVAMTQRAGNAFGTYSLGMKQRLAVAAALLKNPKLLILDEPSNGLDPIGQRDMRQLIRQLGSEGRTIILSSHDMGDVEQLCGRVGVISGGRMLAEGTPTELRGAARLWVRAEPSGESAALAAGFPGVSGVSSSRSDGLLGMDLAEREPDHVAEINRLLVEAGMRVSELRARRRPLESVFLELTGGRTGGADSVREPDNDSRRTPTGRPRLLSLRRAR